MGNGCPCQKIEGNMTITFTNRAEFEKAVDVVFDYNTRLNSAGDIDTGYADMIFAFSDKQHGLRAVERLKAKNIACFTVDESDTISA